MLKEFVSKINNSVSLWMAALSFGATFLSLFVYFTLRHHFAIGYDVFNPLMVLISVIVAAIVVAFYFWRSSKVGEEMVRKYWFPLMLLVSVGYAFVVGIGGYLFAIIFSTAFRNLTYDFVSAPFLLSAYAAMLAYFVSENIARFDRRHFTYLVAFQFLSGLFLAAIRTGDNYWWRGSVCSLGMPVNHHPLLFNFTLVLTGSLLVLLSIFIAPSIKALVKQNMLTKKSATFLKWLYFLLCTMLILIGIFPYGVSESMNVFHIYVGDSIFVFFAIFLMFSAYIFKRFPLRFKIASYFLLLVGVLFYPLHFQVGYLAYAEMELMMILAMVTWFMIFVRTITVMAKET